MIWWQAMLVALLTIVVTKLIDQLVAISNDSRDFRKTRRNKVLDDIEFLKDEVGGFFELAKNWKSVESKQSGYDQMNADEDKLVGRVAKYPAVSNATRDVLHWCKLIATDELDSGDELLEGKHELNEKFKVFLEACETELSKIA